MVKPIRRITCKKCGMRIRDTFGSKLSHVLSQHVDETVENLIINGGENLRQRSFELGKHLRERFTRHAMDTRKS